MVAFTKLPFRRQLGVIMNYSYFVTDEGAHLTWMLFSKPGATWVTVFEYRPGHYPNNMRFHYRTWLLRRNCRMIVYVIEDDKEAGHNVLFGEMEKPYRNGITVVTFRGVIQCDSLVTCANRLDPSLIVEARGSYPLGL